MKPFPVGHVIAIDPHGLKQHGVAQNPTLIMKKHILVPIVFGGLITFSLTTQAQDRPGQGGRGGEGGRGGANPGEGIREAMIKKFDKNGDGKLDEKERPTREQLQEFFRAQLGER
jgi:hypothetical protein